MIAGGEDRGLAIFANVVLHRGHKSADRWFDRIADLLHVIDIGFRNATLNMQIEATLGVNSGCLNGIVEGSAVGQDLQERLKDCVRNTSSATTGRPPLSTIEGHILSSGRLPGAIEFSLPGEGSKRDMP